MAEALYRKYRPQTFEEVVGQEHIERTLKNAISTDKVSHAYLFTGPRGTGKTTTARLLAKALLCDKGPTPDPDGTCEDCTLIASGEHPDVYELDAASRTGVENVREEIIGRVNYAPTRGRYKVYIIDEVHMLSTAAFNALLKTLEEPPAHVVFILCTTDPQKVPETIHSRCQRFDFRRIASEELISRLGAICELEGVEYEGDALDLIAHRAQGGMRDALTSLEQLIAFSDGSVTTLEAERLLGSLDSSDLADIVRAIGQRDAAACFRWTSEYMETGADLAQFTQDLASHMRDMYVMSLTGADVALEVTEAGRRELESELAWFGPDRISRLLSVLGDLMAELKTSTNQRLTFEIALTRMIRPESDITLGSLAERLEALERGMAGQSMRISAGHEMRGGADASHATKNDVAPTKSIDAGREVGSDEAQIAGKTGAGQETRIDADAIYNANREASLEADFPVNASSAKTTGTGEASSSTGAQPPSTSTSAAAISDVLRFWDAVKTNLKKIAEPYGVLFMNTRASLSPSGDRLLVEFDSGNEFAFNASQKPEVREALSEALAKAGAAGMAFEITKAQGGTPHGFAPSQEQSQMQSHPNMQASHETVNTPQQAQPRPPQQEQSVGMRQDDRAQVAQVAQAAPSENRQFDEVGDYSGVPDDYIPMDESFATGEDGSAMSSKGNAFANPSQASPSDASVNSAPAGPSVNNGANEPSANDLNDVLVSAFGDGIVFEEVD